MEETCSQAREQLETGMLRAKLNVKQSQEITAT